MHIRLATLLKRAVVVGLSFTITLALLLSLTTFVALNARWEIPDRRELDAPSVLLDRDGNVIARFTSTQDRQVVPLHRISIGARNAVIAGEDVRFLEHGGVDPVSLLRAVVRNVRTGSIEQGGSTLTQQYVKNAFEGVGNERTVIRKVREAVISVQLERDLSKSEILEAYLNTVFFGEGAYGIEAAAQEYFATSAALLTAAQGAALAQALPAPSVRNPRIDPDGARERRDRILATMAEAGFLDDEQFGKAIDEEMVVEDRRPPDVLYPFFTEYVRKQLIADAAIGEDVLLSGGLQIATSLDPDVQAAIEDAVAEILPRQVGDNADVDAGVVAIDPRTGDVLGLYGGRDFGARQQDLATQGRRQNGSTFKPFGFIAALESGIRHDANVRTPGVQTIQPEDCGGRLGEPWTVSGPGGQTPLSEALTRSINTAFQGLGCRLGPDAIIDVAHRLGVRNEIDAVPAVALGGATFGASVLDMASAYATLANDGLHCPARSVVSLTNRRGEILDPPQERTVVPDMPVVLRAPGEAMLANRPRELADADTAGCLRMLAPDIARLTTQALEGVVERTTGRRAQIGRPQAGKTGTTNDERDAWFVGYTPDLAMAVWVGHAESNDPLRDIEGFARVQGGTLPALIWKAAAERILADVAKTDFLEPGESAADTRAPAPPAGRPTPTPSRSDQPSDAPTADPSDTPTDSPSDDPTGPASPPCIIVLGNCD